MTSSRAPLKIEMAAAHDIPLARQADLFTRSFEGYVGGSFRFDTASLARLFAIQGMDLWLSRLATLDGEPVGFGYINRTGAMVRLAAMGVLLSARRLGVARRLLTHLLREAKDRADQLMTLEVFEQNASAVALYRGMGFQETGRLFGWRRAAAATATLPKGDDVPVEEVPVLDLAHRSAPREYPEIPWQISRHALAKAPPFARAFTWAKAGVAIANPESDPIRFLSLVPGDVEPEDGSNLRALVSVVLRRFPDRSWQAPAIYPEAYGTAIFEPLGFQRESLNQIFMRQAL